MILYVILWLAQLFLCFQTTISWLVNREKKMLPCIIYETVTSKWGNWDKKIELSFIPGSLQFCLLLSVLWWEKIICFGLTESKFLGAKAEYYSLILGILIRKAIVSAFSDYVSRQSRNKYVVCHSRLSNVGILGACIFRI